MKETLDEQSREALVQYRLDRADETLKEVDDFICAIKTLLSNS